MAECGTYSKYARDRCRCDSCVLAGKAYNKAYNETNKDRIRKYREANKARIVAYRKSYREANKARIVEYRKSYGENNTKKLKSKSAEYYWANLDKHKARRKHYYRANRDHFLTLNKNNINQTYGITDEEYNQILLYQEGKCAICKVSNEIKPLLRDHYHEGGTQKRSKRRHNFRGLLCRPCNTYLGHIETRSLNVPSFTEYINNPPAKKVLK